MQLQANTALLAFMFVANLTALLLIYWS